MKDYKNYIFDLYGTLVDIHTEEEDPVVWKKLALFYGYYDANYAPEELKERYHALIGNREAAMKAGREEGGLQKKDDAHESHPEVSVEEIFAQLFAEKGVEADMELAMHAGQFFRILSTDYVKLYDGVEELLASLKEAGKNIYLLSNAQRIFTEYEMHTLGIARYFDDIFISSECGMKKPDSRFFELLIEKHQLEVADSVMIGNDAVSDIAGAKSVGLDTVYIHSNISPKLPVEAYVDENGEQAERTVYPDADYVLEEMELKKLSVLFQSASAEKQVTENSQK